MRTNNTYTKYTTHASKHGPYDSFFIFHLTGFSLTIKYKKSE